MPMLLEGSCTCGAVEFSVSSHTPQPFMRCYCTICRKISGGGGYAINIMATAESLDVTGQEAINEVSVMKDGSLSPMTRSFCARCGAALWGWHPAYGELIHPFASAIDSELPVPVATTHIMLEFKAPWVEPDIRDGDSTFAGYPDQSIEDWHRTRNLWID